MTCWVVDVGVSAVDPFGDLVDFAEISGHCAVRVGAATVAGMQHEALI